MSFTEVTPQDDPLWQIVCNGSQWSGSYRSYGSYRFYKTEYRPTIKSSWLPTPLPVERPPKTLSTKPFAGFPFPFDRLPRPKFLQARSPCYAVLLGACAILLRTAPIRGLFVARAPVRRDVRIPCERRHRL